MAKKRSKKSAPTRKPARPARKAAAVKAPARKPPAAAPIKRKNITIKPKPRMTATRSSDSHAKSSPKPAGKEASKASAARSGKSTAPAAGAGKTAKPTATGKGIAASQAQHAPARVPDAHGYVFINGRRVRMISTKGLVAAKKPKRDSASGKATIADPEAAPRTNWKTKLSEPEIEHYRELLLTKRGELVGDLNAMEAQALKSNGGDLSHMPIHMADIGTDTYDQDFMLSLAENERQQLREIDAALQRIAEGSYAICQLTGKPIPKTRLNAKPWARYTIEAAREFEQGRTA